MLITLNKCNGSELPNAHVISLFRHTTCSQSVSASRHHQIKYRATVTLGKLYKLQYLLSSNLVQTAYCKSGINNRFTKPIYTVVYMILDEQNHHTFPYAIKLQDCNPEEVGHSHMNM